MTNSWMIDLGIEGVLSRGGEVQGPCVWCQKPSTSVAYAKGLAINVPCHILCCAHIIRAARAFLASGLPSPELEAYRRRLEAFSEARLLGSGDAT